MTEGIGTCCRLSLWTAYVVLLIRMLGYQLVLTSFAENSYLLVWVLSAVVLAATAGIALLLLRSIRWRLALVAVLFLAVYVSYVRVVLEVFPPGPGP